MNNSEAFAKFSAWYEECLEHGVSPEEVVAMMGGMALITDQDLISKLQESGDLPE
jgi:hypothetical protein